MKKLEFKAKFEELFGAGGTIRFFSSPRHVNIIGEHADCNGGK